MIIPFFKGTANKFVAYVGMISPNSFVVLLGIHLQKPSSFVSSFGKKEVKPANGGTQTEISIEYCANAATTRNSLTPLLCPSSGLSML